MTSLRSVSVVVPAYNHARFLPQCIESVLAQTAAPREVVVVDDGSTDDTPRVLERYRDVVRVIRQPNQGVAVARNVGVAASSGDLLAFLDADDLWLPRKLERQLERFAADPGLGLVHCGVRDVDAGGRQVAEHLDGMEGWVAREMLFFRRAVILGGGSAAVVSREAFDAVGGFDPALPPSEDWDLYYRVASAFRVGFVPEVLVSYRLHGANAHRNVRATERAMLLAYAKVFRGAGPELSRMRRRCYGELHRMLAGSYYSIGDRSGFVRHALRSLWIAPWTLPRFAGFPLRRLRRAVPGLRTP